LADSGARSPLLWLAVALALAGALAVTLGSRGNEGALGAGGRALDAAEEGPLLTGEQAHGTAAHDGPSLQGMPASAPQAKDGPVTVTVVDPADEPVAGALVVASWTTPPTIEGEQPTPHEKRAITDASGCAHFAHLAYDGGVQVAVHVRLVAADPVQTWRVIRGVMPQEVNGLVRVVMERAANIAVEQGRASREQVQAGELVDLDLVEQGLTGLDVPLSAESQWAHAFVTGPEVRLSVDRGLPLTVHVHEGGDGRMVRDARWKILPRLAWEGPAVASSPVHVPVKRGAPASLTLEVEAPRGTVARHPATFTPWIHPAAKRLDAVYPVRPEARVVLVFPPEVQPFRPEDWQGDVQVAGVSAKAELGRFDAQGRLWMEGLAHLVGERVTVTGSIGERWALTGDAPLGADARELVAVSLVATAAGESGGQFISFGNKNVDVLGLVGVSAPGHGLHVRLANFRSLRLVFVGMTDVPPLPPGSLKVTVLTPTGLPAAGAVVRAGEREVVCDGAGVARLDALEAGEVEVRVLGYGAGAREQVTVASGRESPVTLRCSRGGTLEVEVVDDEGRGLPYATLAVQQADSAPWIDFEGGVQRIDPYTDADGRRKIVGVALGAVKVSASYGSRSAEAEVVVTEGSVATVRLVLPSVPPPAPPAAEPTADGSPPR
jgi:hypothetical protein